MRHLHATPGWLYALASALGVWLAAFGAHAHAPLTRNVAVTPDGAAIAVSLPGFGILYRAQPSAPFAYVCDALLGILPADVVHALAFLDDGLLLVGSANGLRSVAKDGCPIATTSELSDAPVVALALAPSAHQIAYAVVSGAKAGLWRSSDAGKHWELRAPLTTAAGVSALVVSESDPERVLLSESTTQGNVIRASSDGGASLRAYPQEAALTLLHVQSGTRERLWAMARDALTVGNRGRAILRADAPDGPWQTPVRVAYFGGFVIDAQGAISIGDELGGVYRSSDDGQSFHKLPSDVPVACLAQANAALWACTPGALSDPALQTMGASESFASVVALPDVTRLVSCPALDVARICAGAWIEWQRDVLRIPLQVPDAGAPSAAEAGVEDAGAQDAGDTDASLSDASAAMPDDAAGAVSDGPSSAKPSGGSGCSASIANRTGETPQGWLGLCFGLGLLHMLRRRRAFMRRRRSH